MTARRADQPEEQADRAVTEHLCASSAELEVLPRRHLPVPGVLVHASVAWQHIKGKVETRGVEVKILHDRALADGSVAKGLDEEVHVQPRLGRRFDSGLKAGLRPGDAAGAVVPTQQRTLGHGAVSQSGAQPHVDE